MGNATSISREEKEKIMDKYGSMPFLWIISFMVKY